MQDKLKTIKNELAGLINSHSLENGSNTPDFILAAYLLNCLTVFDHANNWNTAWHSKDGVPADWRENGPPTAVRAHDAGTDEEVISYRARQIWRRFVGIPITEPYTAEFQWLLDLLSGNEAPKKTLTEAVQEARGNLEPPTVPIRFDSPASHAAGSTPQQDAEDPAEPPSRGRKRWAALTGW